MAQHDLSNNWVVPVAVELEPPLSLNEIGDVGYVAVHIVVSVIMVNL